MWQLQSQKVSVTLTTSPCCHGITSLVTELTTKFQLLREKIFLLFLHIKLHYGSCIYHITAIPLPYRTATLPLPPLQNRLQQVYADFLWSVFDPFETLFVSTGRNIHASPFARKLLLSHLYIPGKSAVSNGRRTTNHVVARQTCYCYPLTVSSASVWNSTAHFVEIQRQRYRVVI